MKKKWLYVVLAVLIIGGIGSTNHKDSSTDSSTDASTANVADNITPTEAPEPEANTSAMVDSIVNKAKSDADGQLDLDTCKEALSYLKDNYPNYFTDNETMEKVMYYGAFLEYSFEGKGINDVCATLGQDALQTVKYVYRGADAIEDESTQSNLRQVKESLDSASLE